MFRIKATELNINTGKYMETYRFKKTDGPIDELCRDIIDILRKEMGLLLTSRTLIEMINGTYKYKTIISGNSCLEYTRSDGIYSITINNMLAIYIRD